MKPRYLVHVEASKRADGTIELAARHEAPGRAPWRAWYRVPEAWGEALTELADPFAAGSIHQAMLSGFDLEVRGTVSRSLLANLEDYVEAWNCWDPANYHRIEVGADRETEPAPSVGQPTICSYSGGVDSSFTVMRHAKGLAGRRSKIIGAAVFVHGFDIPLDDTSGYQDALARAAEALNRYSIPLIPVVTNWRENGVDWLNAFGSATIACLHLFQRGFRCGIIAGAENYAYHAPLGASPLVDPMLGSAAFEIIHDGAGFNRSQKISLLAKGPCWEASEWSGFTGTRRGSRGHV